jgi:hypothetical protein
LGLPESKIRHLEIASASWLRYFYIQINELFELAPICLSSLYVGTVIAFIQWQTKAEVTLLIILPLVWRKNKPNFWSQAVVHV